jgi:virulence-associated protein VagC
MTDTTVFHSADGQAVRLTKDSRFKSRTVETFRRGDALVLREKPQTLGELLNRLPPITAEDAGEIRLVLENVRTPRPEQDQDWAALWSDDTETASASTAHGPARAAESPKKSRAALRRKA